MGDLEKYIGKPTGCIVGEPVTLLASAARDTTGDGADVVSDLLGNCKALLLVLDVTAQSGTVPTLDVEVQQKLGSNYTEFAQFSRMSAATGAKVLNPKRGIALTTEAALAADPAVSGTTAVVSNRDWGNTFRVSWAIGGTIPSFTFSVVAYPILY